MYKYLKVQNFFLENSKESTSRNKPKNPPNNSTAHKEKYPKVSIEIIDAGKKAREIDLSKSFDKVHQGELIIKPSDIIHENINQGMMLMLRNRFNFTLKSIFNCKGEKILCKKDI